MLTIETDFWYIDQLRFSHATNNLIAAGRKRTGTDNRPLMVKEFDPRAGSPEPEQWLQFPPTSLVSLDPTGRHGAICKRQHNDDYIYFFEWRNRKPGLGSHSISIATAELSAIALCADENKVATLVDERTEPPASMSIDIWNTSDESLNQRLSIFPDAAQLIWSPDGRFLAHAADDGSRVELTRVTDPVTTRLASADGYRLAFSPQGTFLASGGQLTRCWEVESGSLISRFRGQDEDVPDLAFSPDERLLAIARTDGPVEFWDFRAPRLIRSYSWKIGRLSAIAFAPDGLTCAVAGEAGQIVIWDLDDL
jgi:WD40 repeat protein